MQTLEALISPLYRGVSVEIYCHYYTLYTNGFCSLLTADNRSIAFPNCILIIALKVLGRNKR